MKERRLRSHFQDHSMPTLGNLPVIEKRGIMESDIVLQSPNSRHLSAMFNVFQVY